MSSVAEVRRTVSVPLEPREAFDLFTARVSDFWPRSHSIGTSEIAEVVIEPQVGGMWFERGVDGSQCQWGSVVEWAPPHRLVLAWQITADWRFDPDFSTEIHVEFVAEGVGQTRLDLTHRHLERYGVRAPQLRAVFESPAGWNGILNRFADVARATLGEEAE